MAASSAALESCEQGGSSAPDSAGAETPLGQGPVAGVSLPADSQDLVTPPASPEGRVVSSFEQQLEGLLLESEQAAQEARGASDADPAEESWSNLGSAAEDAWYGDVRWNPDEGSVPSLSEWSLVEARDAVPALMKTTRDDQDVQRLAAELERKQAAQSVPRQAWELPGRLSYPWEVKRPMRLIGIADVAASTQSSPPEVPAEMKVNPMVRKYLDRVPVQRSEEESRSHALKNLKFMILFDVEATQLGMSLANLVGRAAEEDEIKKSFSAAFRMKATSTLCKRTSALLKFFRWALSGAKLDSPLNFTEQNLFDYMKVFTEGQGGPTSASQFLEALRFLHGVVVLRHAALDVCISARVKGMAADLYLTKAPLKQRDELTLKMVVALETMIDVEGDRDACILGQHLFCLHSGARWTDGQRLKSIVIQTSGDESFVIAEGLTSKTSMTQEAKTRLLPYAAIGSGVRLPWAHRWLEARHNEGLTLGDFALPGWSETAGKWTSMPMLAGEATSWLQDFLLRAGFMEEEVLKRGSHSLKATLTTWTSRCPTVHFSSGDQRLVGHHVKPKDKSPLVYSRQAYTALYGKILAMFRDIREGRYDPDLPEIDRVLAAAAENSHVQQAEPKASAGPPAIGPIDEASGEEGGSSSEGSEEALSREDRAVVARAPFQEPVDMGLVYVHRVSGVVHCLKDTQSSDFFCGRFLTAAYMHFDRAGAAAADPDCCIQCKRARD